MLQMLQNFQNDAKFQNCQLDNLVDFEKCCKTRIYLQRSVPIQPKTIEIYRKFAASQEAAEMAAALVPFMAGRAAGHHADGGAAVRPGTGPSQLGTSAKR